MLYASPTSPNTVGAAKVFRTSRSMRPTAFARMGRAVLQPSLTSESLGVATVAC
jgi:hypothetical protein